MAEVRERVLADGAALEYANAVTTYLALCTSKMTVFHCSLARWRPDADKTAPAFGRQAIPMVWDFAERMPFAGAGGDWSGVVEGAAKTLEGLHPVSVGHVRQVSATNVEFPPGAVLSTDPPYYDNIPYADLSDFFYVWLRRTLRNVYPDILSTVLVPKAEELVANPFRQGGRDCAKRFFEDGFRQCLRPRSELDSDWTISGHGLLRLQAVRGQMTIGQASTGWETLLEGMIRSGWTITATWPMRTEGERLE